MRQKFSLQKGSFEEYKLLVVKSCCAPVCKAEKAWGENQEKRVALLLTVLSAKTLRDGWDNNGKKGITTVIFILSYGKKTVLLLQDIKVNFHNEIAICFFFQKYSRMKKQWRNAKLAALSHFDRWEQIKTRVSPSKAEKKKKNPNLSKRCAAPLFSSTPSALSSKPEMAADVLPLTVGPSQIKSPERKKKPFHLGHGHPWRNVPARKKKRIGSIGTHTHAHTFTITGEENFSTVDSAATGPVPARHSSTFGTHATRALVWHTIRHEKAHFLAGNPPSSRSYLHSWSTKKSRQYQTTAHSDRGAIDFENAVLRKCACSDRRSAAQRMPDCALFLCSGWRKLCAAELSRSWMIFLSNNEEEFERFVVRS